MKKVWNHVIKVKEGFVLRKSKVYPFSREERGEVCKFIKEEIYQTLEVASNSTSVFYRKERW